MIAKPYTTITTISLGYAWELENGLERSLGGQD